MAIEAVRLQVSSEWRSVFHRCRLRLRVGGLMEGASACVAACALLLIGLDRVRLGALALSGACAR